LIVNPPFKKVAAGGPLPQFPASGGGFTLLELLIAITLLVVILVVTLGAVRIGSRSLAAGEKKIDAQERFRTVLAIMDAQIQSQMPLSYEGEDGKRYYFSGEAKTLRFLTCYSIWSGQRGYVIVDYTIEPEEGGREVLYAQEQTPGIEGRLRTRLIEASGMSFAYFYKSPAEEEGSWTDTLSGGTAVPQKVRFTLTPGVNGFSRVFPVKAQGAAVSVMGRGGVSR
jgi:general secretion pathway protein J